MNEQLKFFKGKETSLENINPQAGSIYHCEDTGNTYLANENSELEIYSNTFTFSAAEADAVVPVNADTLNGKTANDFVTPIQVDDAINEAIENVAYISNLSSDSSLVLADAESLGGLPAENYATKNYVVDTINQAQLGGDNSEVDLSIYATKDDLTLVRNAIPTTPEDIGAKPSDWMPTAEQIGAATTSHNHSANNITSGTLPIARGGTGSTSKANARKNLGLTAFSTYQQTDVNDLQAGINNVWSSVGNGESFIVSVKTSSAYCYTAFGIKIDTNNGYVFAIGQGNLTRLYSKSSGTWTIYTISKSAGA